MSSSATAKKKAEAVSQKSAAEFFTEHQQIAGFDNAGKSLFTTIREFVENSLDAAESIHVLPNIEMTIVEYTEQEHNIRNGIERGTTGNGTGSGTVSASSSAAASAATTTAAVETEPTTGTSGEGVATAKKSASKSSKKGAGEVVKEKDQMYYSVTCKDNGCGIPEKNVGDMLGRVLSGSKHGLRQTRGKFGLGAKMALIWSKKSSGLPIRIRTAHSTSPHVAPATVTSIVLDIDIYKNEPRILSKKVEPNADGWRGTEISVIIAGSWAHYRSRTLQYFQQLAVITPYSNFQLDFHCERDDKKSFRAQFARRSEQMPPIAGEVQPHPKSLNNITLGNLLKESKSPTVAKFLTKELSGVSSSLADKIASNLDVTDISPSSLKSSQVAALCQTLRDETQIRPPAATCLSPAGEYNMRLGVLKELRPKLVATFTEKPGSCEGHPFIVEAAVSIGGAQMREGVNVYRFANRIPLLFETGADVVTQVATKRINWTSYHIDPKKEGVGVYVSIVSTRIPFKGTSKEYIGDDVTEIQRAVKKAILGCCQQLRVSLARSLARKEGLERKKTLVKYIPDVSRALLVVLKKLQEKHKNDPTTSSSSSSSSGTSIREKRTRLLRDLSDGILSEEIISARMHQAVDRLEVECALQAAAASGGSDESGGPSKKVKYSLKEDNSVDRVGVPFADGAAASAATTAAAVSQDSVGFSQHGSGSGYRSSLFSSSFSSSSSSSNGIGSAGKKSEIAGRWIPIASGLQAMILVPSTSTSS